jgi:hypothetical protein
MSDVTNLDARRESKKTTLEKIEAVFTESEIEDHERTDSAAFYNASSSET